MPTIEHNGLVEMFRENPDLAPHLIATLFHVDMPPHAGVEVVEASLDQLIPVEFRADLVVDLRGPAGARVLSIVLEVQRDEDPRKKYTWPVYVTVSRAQKQCAAVVLVVAPDAEVASWAAEKIDLGLGRGTLQPLVVGPATVPEVTDLSKAEADKELAVLSAVAHGNGPHGMEVVLAALTALERFDSEHAAVYFQIVYNALREPMQKALEALVMERQTEGKVQYPPFVQRIFEEAKLEGELKGEIKGKLEGKRDALLRLLLRAGITLTEEDDARIRACADPETLDRWLENVLGAKTADDVLS